ncbi:C-type lectin domain family 4 member M-like isoform X1 [Cheilinus undulatus]|uniref:C-type lectin domain family 4 member M-like isoform X1 n=2 Tax=Cheilinus undulatus TaxID=241271 RepID=UPI001BD24A2A|nr:C-type lectin domain family 4 member M-like isoform X1 [Cheilinus undulatus]XP_041641766.1 C-type lectin domain family 4 member M-like isoform X1 [Cheilinus undulatus]
MEDAKMADEHRTSSVINLVSDNSKHGYKQLDEDDRKPQFSVHELRNNPFRVATLCLGLLCVLLLAGVIVQSVNYQKAEQDRQNKRTAMSKEREDLQVRLKAEQTQKRSLEIIKSQLEDKNNQLSSKRFQLQNSVMTLTQETNKLKASQSQVQDSNAALSRETEQLKASNDQQQLINNALANEKDLLQKEYDIVLQRRNELQTNYDSVTKERNILQNKVNNVSRSRTELQSSYNNLVKDVEQLQERYNSTSMRKDKLVDSYEYLIGTKGILLNTTDRIKKSIAELGKTYGTYVKEQQDLEVRCRTEIQERQRMQVKNDNITAERDHLQGEVERLNATIEGKNCSNGWRRFENSCYFTSVLKKSWAQARQHCQNMGADLAMIKSQDKMNFINGLYKSDKEVWIGLTDDGVEGQWRWVDGSPLGATFWGPGQPNSHNGKNQDCVEFWHRRTGNGQWNDEACDITQNYICEINFTAQ